MGVFICMYIAFAIIALFSKRDNSNNKQVCFYSFLLLWLIQALRATIVGHDSYNTYLPAFSAINISSFSDIFQQGVLYNWEKGYVIYQNFIRLFTSNEHVFLAITSAIVLIPISYTIKKYSKIPWLSFVIFASVILYHFSFSGLRQAIAIALTCYSVRFIEEGKFFPFIIIVLIATQFHASSIIFIIAYLFSIVKFTYRRGVFVVLCIGILFVAIGPVLNAIRPILFGDVKYSSYDDPGSGAFGLTIFYVILTIISLSNYNYNSKDKMTSFFAWMCIMVLAFQPLAIVSDVADRVGYYFLPFYSIMVPNAIARSKCDYTTKMFICVGVYLIMVAVFFYCNVGGYLEVIPYYFFWEK